MINAVIKYGEDAIGKMSIKTMKTKIGISAELAVCLKDDLEIKKIFESYDSIQEVRIIDELDAELEQCKGG
jgi:hypothetical protein